MCGILALITGPFIQSEQSSQREPEFEDSCQIECLPWRFGPSHFIEALSRRGPDSTDAVNVELENGGSISLLSSLLQLRGESKVDSPLTDEDRNVLLYNGEIYGGVDVQLDGNDGVQLLNTLSTLHSDDDLTNFLTRLLGPWSLIYWKESVKEVWFGRDRLGRRSLLRSHLNDQFILSSVADVEDGCCAVWSEVHPGIYKIAFTGNGNSLDVQVVHEWRQVSLSRSLAFDNLDVATGALLTVLKNAIQIRVEACNKRSVCLKDEGSSPILVPFSGGIDSTLIAALLHGCLLPGAPIDLCNVSFQGEEAADRKTAVQALLELRNWAPERPWNLITIDSSLDALEDLKPHMMNLLHPCDTIMDLNIGTPLWLAAKAEGMLYPSSDGIYYKSHARIAFVGHGADEQCVGYSRHRTKYREGGMEALEQELDLEISRLWKRNLGRDDRLISDHGREARFPFLDESVIGFIAQLPMDHLFNPHQPRGVGEKIILRNCLCQLGLGQLSRTLKRAIQFGTHIGKLANKKHFGSNRAANKSPAGSLKFTHCQNQDYQQ